MAQLTVYNTTRSPNHFPVSINNMEQVVSLQGVVDLRDLVGKKIETLEINGVKITFSPAIQVIKASVLHFQVVMGATNSEIVELPK